MKVEPRDYIMSIKVFAKIEVQTFVHVCVGGFGGRGPLEGSMLPLDLRVAGK